MVFWGSRCVSCWIYAGKESWNFPRLLSFSSLAFVFYFRSVALSCGLPLCLISPICLLLFCFVPTLSADSGPCPSILLAAKSPLLSPYTGPCHSLLRIFS